MALEQQEQRLRMQLNRKNSALQNAISDANVQKRLAESASETPQSRAKARAKYNELQTKVTKLRSEVKELEADVKRERGRKKVEEVKKNYDRLKEQYDLLLDKNSPEAERIGTRVNEEVKKLNAAYQQAGQSTRVSPLTLRTQRQKDLAQAQREREFGIQVPKAGAVPSGATIETGANVGKGAKAGRGTVTGPGGTVTTATTATVTATTATGDKPKTKEQRYADAVAMAMREYNMPDIIFRNVKSLGELLKRYVDDKLTDEQFALEIQNDPWYRSNSAEIKARYVQLFNYEDLVKQGRAMGTTDYEQQIARITRTIQARARELNGIEIPDDQAKLIAKDLYIFNLSDDPAVLTERLVSFIRPSGGMIGGQPTIGYGGQALANYQQLQAIAKANGFKIQDILPKDAMGKPMTAEGILEQLALGKLDINRIAQDVRKLAAVGQPDYVKDLLGQGYNLENIYAPYRDRMSTVLELDPNTISLNDPTLRMGITKEGDMNLYDFEKALRRDSRWQYTQNARSEVSGSVLQVLRDFGFQG